jgi:DNA-binding NtrC family response regulator
MYRQETRAECVKKPPGIETDAAANVVVLSISPTEEDHTALNRILSRPESTASTESRWTIYPAVALKSALPLLRENPIAIVLSERDLAPGTWKDVLAETMNLSDPPLLIVASRLADEYLWAEALNLGAYDVLAKPFDAEEVIRVFRSAWFHKCTDREIRNLINLKMAAAG